jgi:hypothetical protein
VTDLLEAGDARIVPNALLVELVDGATLITT